MPLSENDRRFIAVLRRVDGTFEQVSDYAVCFGDAENKILRLYILGMKNPRDPWRLVGSSIERITFDDYADKLPEHDFLDQD